MNNRNCGLNLGYYRRGPVITANLVPDHCEKCENVEYAILSVTSTSLRSTCARTLAATLSCKAEELGVWWGRSDIQRVPSVQGIKRKFATRIPIQESA